MIDISRFYESGSLIDPEITLLSLSFRNSQLDHDIKKLQFFEFFVKKDPKLTSISLKGWIVTAKGNLVFSNNFLFSGIFENEHRNNLK